MSSRTRDQIKLTIAAALAGAALGILITIILELRSWI